MADLVRTKDIVECAEVLNDQSKPGPEVLRWLVFVFGPSLPWPYRLRMAARLITPQKVYDTWWKWRSS